MDKFPKDFLWGAATSSHQVEGSNTNNDWCFWEEEGNVRERSGKACNHYALFEQDFDLAQELGHNAHRFSIEWSRIEPEENSWDEKELDHYKKVITALKSRNIEPIITLHHFTNPLWFFQKGGWLNKEAAFYFNRYVEKVVSYLGAEVKYWITINEPVVFAYHSYLIEKWPPGGKSLKSTFACINNFVAAHKLAYKRIHEIYNYNSWPFPMVSFSKNFEVFSPCDNFPSFLNRIPSFLRSKLYNDYFLNRVNGFLDFIGLNYYTREVVKCSFEKDKFIFGENCNSVHQHFKKTNFMGWIVSAEGLLQALLKLNKFRLPILITENGTCNDSDDNRWVYIKEHLAKIKEAVDENVPVFGYLYWSLLDNFEWGSGYSPRFGLIDVDYNTFERRIRGSALKLKDFIEKNTK